MFGAKIETHPKRLMVKICPLAISTLLRVPTSTRFLPLSVDLNEAKRKGERERGWKREKEGERERGERNDRSHRMGKKETWKKLV